MSHALSNNDNDQVQFVPLLDAVGAIERDPDESRNGFTNFRLL